MIPRAYIDAWRATAPSATDARAQFEANLAEKAGSPEFRGDIVPLLRPGTGWDFDEALAVVSERLVGRLTGEPWRGE